MQCCTKCYGLANNSNKEASATLLFFLQPRYLIVLLCQFVSTCIVQTVCVFVLYGLHVS